VCERERERERNRKRISMRKEKSISWNLIPIHCPKTLSIHFSYRRRIQDTAGKPTYNLGRRLLIQSRPVRRQKGGRQGARSRRGRTLRARITLGNPKPDGRPSRIVKRGVSSFTLKSRDLSSSLVQLCAPRLQRGFVIRAIPLFLGGDRLKLSRDFGYHRRPVRTGPRNVDGTVPS